MVSFDSRKLNCVICPYGCSGCDNDYYQTALSTTTSSDTDGTSTSSEDASANSVSTVVTDDPTAEYDPFPVYEARCYDCKSLLARKYVYKDEDGNVKGDVMDFQIKFERERQKCVLCI